MANKTLREPDGKGVKAVFSKVKDGAAAVKGVIVGKDGKKPSKKRIILIAVCAVVLLIIIVNIIGKLSSGGSNETEYEQVTVERKSITRTVDGSSVVEANDTYNVTALVTGEIMSDTFNEGDIVTKDQVLYTIDSDDAQKSVSKAKNNLTKAQQTFIDAVKKKADTVKANSMSEKTQKNAIQNAIEKVASAQRSLDEINEDYRDLTITAELSGTISEVLVKKGDSVNDGTQLAKIYDSSKLKVQVPFNEADANRIDVGSTAELTIAASGDKVTGTVTNVASSTVATAAHAIVKYVTITVDNPGGLTTADKASAVVNGIACSDIGAFEYYDEGYIKARSSGEIGEIYLEKNDKITAGQVVGYITSQTIENNRKNAQDSLASAKRSQEDAYTQLEKLVMESDTYALDSSIKSAELSLSDARIQLEEAEENLEDYEITAPIDGTIVTKNKKAGDKLEMNSGSSSNEPMAVIYDMSTLSVQLTIDETDIHDVKVDQEVMITADAVEGTFTGKVTKVGVDGTSSNGVTTYPVEVTIEEYGDLLPGMNVDCVITVESAEDVLAVPVQAIQRGNMVYLEGKKTDENDKAPDGYHTVDVKTGVTDGMFIEIKEGLNEGDVVCGAQKSSGIEAEGSAGASQQQMGGMGGMGGPPSGGMGGPPSGGMGGPPSGGGNRGGGSM